MWDVLLALQWTNQQIQSFGGNPKKIVLAAQGAGAICNSLMTLSPLAQNLYHSAILFSGTMFSPYVNLPDDVNLKRYSDVAIALGCDSADRKSDVYLLK